MKVNYHTHTARCRHASGTDEEYVKCAMDAGVKVLGFSDHTPYVFPDGHYSTFRMFMHDLDGYCQSVTQLREQYADCIEIHLGVEAEYYPAFFPELLQILRDHQVEYLILGQHYIGNEIGESYSGSPADEENLARYCRQCMDAMQTGLFTYLAHPDLLRFVGDEKVYRHHMKEVCREAKSCGIPLELNLLGIQTNRHYPRDHFWELVSEENCTVVLGRDAHSPEVFLDTATELKALEWVRKYDLKLTEDILLRSL